MVPLISPPEEYMEEATFMASVLRSASIPVREVLELGSGGGHNAVTTVDAAELCDHTAPCGLCVDMLGAHPAQAVPS